jgi:hypothetical protein
VTKNPDSGNEQLGPSRNERAFVVQFDPVPTERSRLRGRVEVVASGNATHFRSVKQLTGFMIASLRRRTTP